MTNKNTLRQFGVSLALVLFVGILSVSGTLQAQAAPDATVNAAVLKIRSAPSSTADVVAEVTKGTTMTLDGRDNTGTWVHGTTSTNVVGWASRFFLVIRSDLNVNKLPILNGASAAAPAAPGAPTPTAGQPGGAAPSSAASLSVSGHIGRNMELGGQVRDIDGFTADAMRRAGMRWAKFLVGVGDNIAYDYINRAHAAGFKALLSVKGDRNNVLTAGYPDQFAGYAGTLAIKGADAIEVWNEANLDREWPTGQISPTVYTRILARTYTVIKRVHRSTLVISGAPSPTGGAPGGRSDAFWNDDAFYRGMAAAGAGSYADCIGVHYNEGIVPPNQTSGGWTTYPTNYFDTMLNRALASFPGKRACFTEFGYLSPEGFPFVPDRFSWARNTTVAQQAAWLAQGAVRASASGRVRLLIIWNVNVGYYGGDDPQAGYAIIRPGGACPACDTLGKVAR